MLSQEKRHEIDRRTTTSLFSTAIERALGEPGRGIDPMIRPSAEDKFGDYQSNLAMGLAKKLGAKPRDVAQKIVDALAADPNAAAMCQPFEIAGPGFINIRLRPEWMADLLNADPAAVEPDRLGLDPAEQPQTVVVDYSGPTSPSRCTSATFAARSSAMPSPACWRSRATRSSARTTSATGAPSSACSAPTSRRKCPRPSRTRPASTSPTSRASTARPTLSTNRTRPSTNGRAEVVALHNHDETTLRAWRYIVDESRNHYMPVYHRLGVSLRKEDERGESFYAERLPKVVEELEHNFGQGAPL